MEGRTSISQSILSQLPTNNVKLISAKRLRDLEEIFNISKFNLIDDDLNDIAFDGTGTDIVAVLAGDALIEVNNKIEASAVLASGTINIGNATSHSVGQGLVVTGDFAAAEVAAVISGNDELFTIDFTSALATNDYIAIIMVKSNSGNYDVDNDLLVGTFKNPTTTSFQIALRKLAVVTTNVQLYVKIMKM